MSLHFRPLRSRTTADPLQVAAQFAAYTWFLKEHGRQAQVDAAHFAKHHWRQFMTDAHEGVGKLLIRITTRPNPSAKRIRKLVRQRRLKMVSGPN